MNVLLRFCKGVDMIEKLLWYIQIQLRNTKKITAIKALNLFVCQKRWSLAKKAEKKTLYNVLPNYMRRNVSRKHLVVVYLMLAVGMLSTSKGCRIFSNIVVLLNHDESFHEATQIMIAVFFFGACIPDSCVFMWWQQRCCSSSRIMHSTSSFKSNATRFNVWRYICGSSSSGCACHNFSHVRRNLLEKVTRWL